MEILYENNKIIIYYLTRSELIEAPIEYIMYIYINIGLKRTRHSFRTRVILTYNKDKNTMFVKHENINCLKSNYKYIVVNAINNPRYIYNIYSYLFKQIRKLNK